MISRNNLPQSRWDRTQKKDKSRCNLYKSVDLIPTTQQLSLFESFKQIERSSQGCNTKDDQPYPLQIGYVSDTDRNRSDRFCRLIHHESKIDLPGQFSHAEAKKILQITRDWDFSLDANGIPRCRDKLLLLLDLINSRHGGESNA